jgi:putrescine transport system permease protein
MTTQDLGATQGTEPGFDLGRLNRERAWQRLGKRFVIWLPYLWLLLFFLIPFIIVLKISFAEKVLARPPYSALLQWVDESHVAVQLFFGNFDFLFSDALYVSAYFNSLKVAAVSTILALLVGYPMAYGIARSGTRWRGPLLMLVILPFWTSFLIRVYAWIGILADNGILNNFLIWLGIAEPGGGVRILYTEWAMYIGIVYSYLPFMVLPLYATLEKMDVSLVEAAQDLGCKPFSAFFKITLPLSTPGIVAGSLLVFIPVVGEYVIPELLGGPDALMIGRVLSNEFFQNNSWPVASAVAVALLLVLIVPIMIFQYVQSREQQERRA